MRFTHEIGPNGEWRIKVATEVSYHVYGPNPHMICEGVYIPITILNEDMVQIGNKIIHRSALSEGGWHEYDITQLIDGSANS